MGEGRSLKTSGYFSLVHICLPEIQRTGRNWGGGRELPLIASAVLKISRLGVYRTTDPKHVINSIVRRQQEYVWSHTVSLVAAHNI